MKIVCVLTTVRYNLHAIAKRPYVHLMYCFHLSKRRDKRMLIGCTGNNNSGKVVNKSGARYTSLLNNQWMLLRGLFLNPFCRKLYIQHVRLATVKQLSQINFYKCFYNIALKSINLVFRYITVLLTILQIR
jgi:hypothetical protein